MRKMDYHVHSLHSYDGIQSIEEMCKTMISLGVQEVCLTEHFDLDHPDDDCQGIPDWETWSREIQYVNQKYPNLMIKRGIEVAMFDILSPLWMKSCIMMIMTVWHI